MAAAFDKSLGTKSENTTGTTMTLTTAAAAVSGSRVFAFVVWSGTQTLTSLAGGSLSWAIDRVASTTGVNLANFNVAICSADAPAGLASGTVLTATFSAAAAAHGLIAAASFTGPVSQETTEAVGDSSTSTAWAAQVAVNSGGGLVVSATASDNTGTNTPASGTEIHDFADVNFSGSLTTEYALVTGGTPQLIPLSGTLTVAASRATAIVAYYDGTAQPPGRAVQKRRRVRARH